MRTTLRGTAGPMEDTAAARQDGQKPDLKLPNGALLETPRKKIERRRSGQSSFLVLTTMTISTLVCWTPSQVLNFLQTYARFAKSSYG